MSSEKYSEGVIHADYYIPHFSIFVNKAKVAFRNILLDNLEPHVKGSVSFYSPQTWEE